MKKIVVFGNSGSGKSTLARQLCTSEGLSHLDLDTLAWRPGSSPERRPLQESRQAIDAFLASSPAWVIEGCYSDLLEFVVAQASEIVFLDLPVETCVANAENRPWEPHKYASKTAQDANLAMLLDWIGQYAARTDTFSRSAHQNLYEGYAGKKTRYTTNDRPT